MPISVVQKWNPGFVLQVATKRNRTFFKGEEDILVQPVVEECKKHGYIENTALVRLACDLRDEVFTSFTVCQKRARLTRCKSSTRWMKRFVARNKVKLANKVLCPVKSQRFSAFKTFFSFGQPRCTNEITF